jgi:hypothetical protein
LENYDIYIYYRSSALVRVIFKIQGKHCWRTFAKYVPRAFLVVTAVCTLKPCLSEALPVIQWADANGRYRYMYM